MFQETGVSLSRTDPTATKIRAEDGRSVSGVDISSFINGLPGGKSTSHFSTADASGSTSQASAIVEALEVGATTLLIDEDTAATNFMIRDARMERLVKSDPITPFIHRVRSLACSGVSSVLVVGGCGDYFEVADLIICMEDYLPRDATQEAKSIVAAMPRQQLKCCGRATPIRACNHKGHHGTVFESRQGKVVARRIDCLSYGNTICTWCVEQLCELSQVRCIADIMVKLGIRANGVMLTPLAQVLTKLKLYLMEIAASTRLAISSSG